MQTTDTPLQAPPPYIGAPGTNHGAPVQYVQQVPMVIQPQQTVAPVVIETFSGTSPVVLGFLQILLGVAAISLSSVAFAVDASMAAVAQGIWGGCLVSHHTASFAWYRHMYGAFVPMLNCLYLFLYIL